MQGRMNRLQSLWRCNPCARLLPWKENISVFILQEYLVQTGMTSFPASNSSIPFNNAILFAMCRVNCLMTQNFPVRLHKFYLLRMKNRGLFIHNSSSRPWLEVRFSPAHCSCWLQNVVVEKANPRQDDNKERLREPNKKQFLKTVYI